MGVPCRGSMSEHILTEKKGNVYWITFSRESKRNCITTEMYLALINAFDEADADPEVALTVLTGTGLYYSAGSDFSPIEMTKLSGLTDNPILELQKTTPYKIWVDRLIRHTKPVVALVNGPAFGIAVTTLALCDAVIASDQATFTCPFTQLGLNPEGASSYTFVAAMGPQKAARLALFAERMTAEEAYTAGLVSKLIPHKQFQEESRKFVDTYSKLGKESLAASKRLLRPQKIVDELLEVNRKEYEVLIERMASEEAIERLMQKFGSKSKI